MYCVQVRPQVESLLAHSWPRPGLHCCGSQTPKTRGGEHRGPLLHVGTWINSEYYIIMWRLCGDYVEIYLKGKESDLKSWSSYPPIMDPGRWAWVLLKRPVKNSRGDGVDPHYGTFKTKSNLVSCQLFI